MPQLRRRPGLEMQSFACLKEQSSATDRINVSNFPRKHGDTKHTFNYPMRHPFGASILTEVLLRRLRAVARMVNIVAAWDIGMEEEVSAWLYTAEGKPRKTLYVYAMCARRCMCMPCAG
jgi:hypothetical protein